jgi:hypothetical protein
MNLRLGGWILLLAITVVPALQAKDMLLRRPAMKLDVDASGATSNFQCVQPMGEDLCALLTKAAKAWEFAPGTRDNAAAAMTIKVTFVLQATKRKGGYELLATDVSVDEAIEPAAGATLSAPDGYETPLLLTKREDLLH